jgi:hypothetical protein
VFITGINPATQITKSDITLDNYVVALNDENKFMPEYMRIRGSQQKKAGKKAVISKTRKNIMKFAEWTTSKFCGDVCVYECNVNAYPTDNTEDLQTLKKEKPDIYKRGEEVFSIVLEALKPQVIVAHGSDTYSALEALSIVNNVDKANNYNPKLKKPPFEFKYVDGSVCHVIPSPHFSGNWNPEFDSDFELLKEYSATVYKNLLLRGL